MDKFFNLMYDFFAFALPGSCVIVSFFLLFVNGEFLYHSAIPIQFKESLPHFFIILIFTGYIVGYTITPLGRLILDGYLIIKINSNKGLRKKPLSFKNRRKLIYYTRAKNKKSSLSLSKIFIGLRENTRISSQYIEFWDMHSKMSSNFSIATTIYLIVQILNYFNILEFKEVSNFDAFLNSLFLNPYWIILSTITLFIIIISTLENSVRYCVWWSEDIEEACRFCK